MAIGIVSNDDFEKELINSSEIKTPDVEIKDLPTKGRGAGRENIPDTVRKLIGGEAITNGHGSGKELAGLLGVSESSVSAYQKGATSTATINEPQPGLLAHINQERVKVAKKAREKLTLAIDAITEEKLNGASPRVASGVAKDMSAVVRDMEPVSERDREDDTKFVFFVPPMKKEEQFEVIDVKE